MISSNNKILKGGIMGATIALAVSAIVSALVTDSLCSTWVTFNFFVSSIHKNPDFLLDSFDCFSLLPIMIYLAGAIIGGVGGMILFAIAANDKHSSI